MDDKRLITFIDDEAHGEYACALDNFMNKRKQAYSKRSIWQKLNPVHNWSDNFVQIGDAASLLAATPQMIKMKKLRQAGVVPFPNKEASKYNFTPGHPRENEVYAVHPINSGSYFPLSDYHHATFESKTCELISILMHLGATAISVQHKTGWGHDFAGSINVGMPGSAGDTENSAGASVSGHGSHASDVLFEAKFNGNEAPCLPEEMIWYEFEPTWKQMAEARMKFGSKEFQLSLDYSEDFGINAELVAKIEKVGGKISGEFSNHKKTVWVVKGEFA